MCKLLSQISFAEHLSTTSVAMSTPTTNSPQSATPDRIKRLRPTTSPVSPEIRKKAVQDELNKRIQDARITLRNLELADHDQIREIYDDTFQGISPSRLPRPILPVSKGTTLSRLPRLTSFIGHTGLGTTPEAKRQTKDQRAPQEPTRATAQLASQETTALGAIADQILFTPLSTNLPQRTVSHPQIITTSSGTPRLSPAWAFELSVIGLQGPAIFRDCLCEGDVGLLGAYFYPDKKGDQRLDASQKNVYWILQHLYRQRVTRAGGYNMVDNATQEFVWNWPTWHWCILTIAGRVKVSPNGCWTFQSTVSTGGRRSVLAVRPGEFEKRDGKNNPKRFYYYARAESSTIYPTAARVMCALAFGPPMANMPDGGRCEASHLCYRKDNPCVNPQHLRWESGKDNLSREPCAKRGHIGKCNHLPRCIMVSDDGELLPCRNIAIGEEYTKCTCTGLCDHAPRAVPSAKRSTR